MDRWIKSGSPREAIQALINQGYEATRAEDMSQGLKDYLDLLEQKGIDYRFIIEEKDINGIRSLVIQVFERNIPLNAFGLPVYSIQEVVQDPEIERVIRLMADAVFLHLGIPAEKSPLIMDECLALAKASADQPAYENSTHELLEREGVTAAIPKKLEERAKIIFSQIRPFLAPGAVLDYGCGDGRLAELVAGDGLPVHLADVYEHAHVSGSGLPFSLIEGQNGSLAIPDNQFENTLLLTVLHHSDNPVNLLSEARRVTKPGGKVIVIESVYGVTGRELEPGQPVSAEFLALSPEQQRRVNIFFDHFYNRAIHFNPDPAKKVNVPFNFNPPEEWKKIFESRGFIEEQVIHLGLDQQAVPEYHTLHILTVVK
jgi:ubiquinone/menaquinone biosynthesis C-methylase UbiE